MRYSRWNKKKSSMKYNIGYKSRRFNFLSKTKSIISYFGGKYYLASKLNEIFSILGEWYGCDIYGELCGGGARCLLNLSEDIFKVKIYNDISIGLCNLFTCVKDKQLCEELKQLLNSLPFEKSLFEFACKNKDSIELDKLYRAALTYINVMQSYNAGMQIFKLGENERVNEILIKQYYNKINRIDRCTESLKNTIIINGDFRDRLAEFKSYKNMLVYLDVPYHPITIAKASGKTYPYVLTREEHQELVKILLELDMLVVLSGYDPAQYGCSDYEPLNEENGIIKASLGYVNRPSSSQGGDDSKKEEFIWIKVGKENISEVTGILSHLVSQ